MRSRSSSPLLRAWVALLVTAMATPVIAQTPSSSVSAEALFQEGRKLMEEKKYDQACPKFADSQKIAPSPSTLINLAFCYEKAGRTASAWATYRDAASAAKAAGRDDYFTLAQKGAAALEPKLSKLTIVVTAPPAGLEVKRDGNLVTASELGAPIPTDAGTHEIVANAPGRKEWKGNVDVGADGATASIVVPELLVAPETPKPKLVEPTPTGARSPLGLVIAGGGVVVTGIGVVFALHGKSKFDESMTFCRTKTDCDPTGVSLRDDARRAGTIATITLGVGAAAIVGGVVLWLASGGHENEKPYAATAEVRFVPTLGGAALMGSF